MADTRKVIMQPNIYKVNLRDHEEQYGMELVYVGKGQPPTPEQFVDEIIASCKKILDSIPCERTKELLMTPGLDLPDDFIKALQERWEKDTEEEKFDILPNALKAQGCDINCLDDFLRVSFLDIYRNRQENLISEAMSRMIDGKRWMGEYIKTYVTFSLCYLKYKAIEKKDWVFSE